MDNKVKQKLQTDLEHVLGGSSAKPGKLTVGSGVGQEGKLLCQIQTNATGDPDSIELRVTCPMTIKKSEIEKGLFKENGNRGVAEVLRGIAQDLENTSPELFQ